jgi:hypothetical protein
MRRLADGTGEVKKWGGGGPSPSFFWIRTPLWTGGGVGASKMVRLGFAVSSKATSEVQAITKKISMVSPASEGSLVKHKALVSTEYHPSSTWNFLKCFPSLNARKKKQAESILISMNLRAKVRGRMASACLISNYENQVKAPYSQVLEYQPNLSSI